MSRLLCLAFLVGLIVAVFQPAYSLPAFARREGVSCQLCHYRMPELNESGREYLIRGLREEPPAAGATAATTPAPKVALGMPVNLNWANYITVMGESTAAAAKGSKLSLSAGGIDLWAAGPFDPNWTAAVDAAFDADAGGVSIDQAYAQYNSSWSDRFVSARFGQSRPFAITYTEGGPSMSISAPLILGDSATADTANSWTPTTPLRLVEVGGVDLNKGDAYLGFAQPNLGSDVTAHTDIYGTADYKIGNTDDLATLYGYFGKASLETGDQSFHRIGAFLNLYHFNSKEVLGYLQGSDDTGEGPKLDNSGYFLLVEHPLSDRFATYARYDHFHRDLLGGGTDSINGPTAGVTWWAMSQVRLTLEAQLQKETDSPQSRTLTADLLWAF